MPIGARASARADNHRSEAVVSTRTDETLTDDTFPRRERERAGIHAADGDYLSLRSLAICSAFAVAHDLNSSVSFWAHIVQAPKDCGFCCVRAPVNSF